MIQLPESGADEADRKRVTLWLAAVIIGLGVLGFGSFWLKWKDGVDLALGFAIVVIPGALRRPDSAAVEDRRAAYWRGVRRVIFVGFAVLTLWVAFRLYQRPL